MQVVAESSRSGGRGRSVELSVQCCSVCCETGHNARTYQVVSEASEDEYST
jgi:hypothetical protein